VGKERGGQPGAGGHASFRASTKGKLFVHLTWKAVHSRWGVGSSRLSTQGCLSGAVGQVGAVLSAPVARLPSQMLKTLLPPRPFGRLPPVVACKATLIDEELPLRHSPPVKNSPSLLPLTQLPPPDAATEPGCCICRSWRNPSFLTIKLALFHLLEEREGGGNGLGIRKEEEQV
jgi:hypothetical protein